MEETKILSALLRADSDCWLQVSGLRPEVFAYPYSHLFSIARFHYMKNGTSLDRDSLKRALVERDFSEQERRDIVEAYIRAAQLSKTSWSVESLIQSYQARRLARGLKDAIRALAEGFRDGRGRYYGGVEGARMILSEMEASLDPSASESEIDPTAALSSHLSLLPFPLLEPLGGILEGELWLLSGFPGDGKTTLMLNMALDLLLSGRPPLIISLETSPVRLKWKLACMLSAEKSPTLSYERLLTGRLSPDETSHLKSLLSDISSIKVRRVTGYGVSEILSLLRAHSDISVVFIDYLGLLYSRSTRFFNEIGEAIKSLFKYGQNTRTSIVCLTQVNREGYRSAQETGYYSLRALADTNESERTPDGVMWLLRTGYLTSRMGVSKRRELPYDPTKFVELSLHPQTLRMQQTGVVTNTKSKSSFSSSRDIQIDEFGED